MNALNLKLNICRYQEISYIDKWNCASVTSTSEIPCLILVCIKEAANISTSFLVHQHKVLRPDVDRFQTQHFRKYFLLNNINYGCCHIEISDKRIIQASQEPHSKKKRVIIVAGVARLLGWIGYFINLRRQIINILGKETKNILREVFNMLKSVFVKRNIKCSLGEENIMTILSVFCRMDPEPIIRNEKAMAIVREAVLRSRLVITVFTIFATLLAEFYTVYVRIIPLKWRLLLRSLRYTWWLMFWVSQLWISAWECTRDFTSKDILQQ